MKKRIKTSMILAALILISVGLFAQLDPLKKQKGKPKFPAWVSKMGYWVVETNINSPKNHVISFYTNDNILMYSEALKNVKLNPEKRAVKMKLKKTLESSVIAWYHQKTKNPSDSNDQSFVKAVFK